MSEFYQWVCVYVALLFHAMPKIVVVALTFVSNNSELSQTPPKPNASTPDVILL